LLAHPENFSHLLKSPVLDFLPEFCSDGSIIAFWQVQMCHEVIPKTLFLPFCGILTIIRPFALMPLPNADRDVISNNNSALFLKYGGSLLG
jgi:hypothetical protein